MNKEIQKLIDKAVLDAWNKADLLPNIQVRLYTEIDQALQLLQSRVSSGSSLQTCRKCKSMIFNADGTKCIQCNENHY